MSKQGAATSASLQAVAVLEEGLEVPEAIHMAAYHREDLVVLAEAMDDVHADYPQVDCTEDHTVGLEEGPEGGLEEGPEVGLEVGLEEGHSDSRDEGLEGHLEGNVH